ncbi:MAG: hypothetical protein HFJ50_01975 [Clostridia bacterium]|jgi:hypothetical protein|nr:hypothetical protein [Clostridia bacterium]
MYSVEYSSNQKCFHIDKLERSLKLNFGNFIRDKMNDYQIIKIFKTIEEVDDFCEEFTSEMRKRQIERKY